jgi:hypothetical protein
MQTVTLTLHDVSIPGVRRPVSGEVIFLPASWGWDSPPERAEVIDARLLQEDGRKVPLLTEEGYEALLAACECAHEILLEQAYRGHPEYDSELPF